MKFEQVAFGPISLQRVTSRDVIDTVFRSLREGHGGRIITANVEFLQRAHEDPALAAIYEASELRVADGMPVLWLARLAGWSFPERVAGSDLVWRFAERAAIEGRSLYLLGGDDGVAEIAARVLRERYPTLKIAGISAPRVAAPPTQTEIEALARELTRCAPDIVYCAFGTPKQEQIASALADALPHTWWLGCGASLSFIAGHMQRAPRWVQRLGLEWLHRTLQEPGRLGRRYLLRNLPFLAGAAFRALRQR